MKKNLLFSFLLTTALLCSLLSFSQRDKFVYAVTDLEQSGSGWNALRRLNLSTGEYTDVLLNGTNAQSIAFDANSKAAIDTKIADPKFGNYMLTPFNTGVAAIAFDSRRNRLYYTPMFIDQLRYIDLNTMKLYYVTGQNFSSLGSMHGDEGKAITRMVITPEGEGYAITNDGNNFIHFNTTGKKIKVESLGGLMDDPSNTNVSIHNRCGGYGGDMIAADDGSLYIVSAQNYLFKIEADSRIAKSLGRINGLPADFTTNGVAVDDENRLVLSSAVSVQGWYTVDIRDLKANPVPTPKGVYRSSDLANSNVLKTGKKTLSNDILKPIEIIGSNKVQVYPNPVRDNVITVQFKDLTPGNYSLELTDILGRQVMQKKIGIGGEQQTEKININPNAARGIYLVKLRDQESKEVFLQKVVVQ